VRGEGDVKSGRSLVQRGGRGGAANGRVPYSGHLQQLKLTKLFFLTLWKYQKIT
jgi:hypothetical protein